jgi:maltooligosyltrehalose synthase
MWATIQAMRFRRDYSEVFRRGEYSPLYATAPYREHVVAFARSIEAQRVIVAVPRFVRTLVHGVPRPPLGEEVWKDASVELFGETSGEFRNVLTGEIVAAHGGHLLCREVFASFPVALLTTV